MNWPVALFRKYGLAVPMLKRVLVVVILGSAIAASMHRPQVADPVRVALASPPITGALGYASLNIERKWLTSVVKGSARQINLGDVSGEISRNSISSFPDSKEVLSEELK